MLAGPSLPSSLSTPRYYRKLSQASHAGTSPVLTDFALHASFEDAYMGTAVAHFPSRLVDLASL